MSLLAFPRILSLWTLPNTLLGLVLAKLGGAGYVKRYEGAWLFTPGRFGPWRWWVAQGWVGVTFGEVVIITSLYSSLLRHELAHVRQYRAWGPLFLPAYGLASLWAWATGRHYYRDNAFEKAAREAE